MNGVAILKEHLFFTLCDGGLSISNDDHYFNSKLLRTDKHPSPSSLINDKNTKQKHDTNQLPLPAIKLPPRCRPPPTTERAFIFYFM